MSGTILPPTKAQIESENRQLKAENDNLKSLLGDFVRTFQEEADSAFCRLYFVEAAEILAAKSKKRAAMDTSESVDY